ncbi:MAG: Trm112 family protein [Planctomycetota bacterium]|nr:MAG: Trm112 family protein [Planctomycetota bacterium]
MSALDPLVLSLLACPAPDCRAALEEVADGLRCTACGRVYPTASGWPVLIPEEGSPPTQAERDPETTAE